MYLIVERAFIMPSMNVSLTNELMRLVQSKVASGMYNNASEVVREALRNLDSNESLLYELKLARLREALEPGIQQAFAGEFSDYSLHSLIDELNSENKTH